MESGHQKVRVEEVQVNVTERINAVAQRLDELADEGSSELTTLAEELGRIADDWQQPVVAMDPATKPHPEWLLQIESLVEQHAAEIVARRYGQVGGNPDYPYVTVNLPNRGYYPSRAAQRYSAGLPALMASKDLFKGVTV